MNSHSEDHTTKKEWVICGVSIFGSAGRYLATSFSSKFYSTDFFSRDWSLGLGPVESGSRCLCKTS